MCGTQSHITLQILTKFTYERFIKKVPVKLQVPENCILPGFLKILPPRRHSLGQRARKGCGILSFSPSL